MFPHDRITYHVSEMILLLSCLLVGLSVAQPSNINVTSTNAVDTCPSRSINYIQPSLPLQCHKRTWPGVADSRLSHTTESPQALPTEQHKQQGPLADETRSHPPSSNTVKDTEASRRPTEEEDLPRTFISFEDWKDQRARDAIRDGPAGGTDDVAEAIHAVAGDEDGQPSKAEPVPGEASSIAGKTASSSHLAEVDQDQQEDPILYDEDKAHQYRSKDAGKTCKERFSYSSFDAGATVLKTNPGAKNPKAILVENKDSYMLLECAAKNKFAIVELTDDILIDTVVLANFEFFSSMVRQFRVSVSDRYPVKLDKWKVLGTFEAKNSRDIQPFLVPNPQIWAKYVRIEFLSHYGNEYYCPVSLLRIHGTRMLDSWKETESTAEDDDHEAIDSGEEVPGTATAVTTSSEQLEDSQDVQNERGDDRSDATSSNPEFLVLAVLRRYVADEKLVCSDRSSPGTQDEAKGMSATEDSHPSATTPTFTSPLGHVQAAVRTATSEIESEVGTLGNQAPSDVGVNTTAVSTSSSLTRSPGPKSSTESTKSPSSSAGASRAASASSAHRNRNGTSTSPSPASPTVQESFHKTVSKRLQLLETNVTLSLNYLEDQSRILQQSQHLAERTQLAKVELFLDNLNVTVLSELRNVRQQYDQIWQSTVIALENQKDQSQRELLALSSRLNLLADEVVFQKRMAIVQAMLLLSCLALVIFSRSANAPIPAVVHIPAATKEALRAHSSDLRHEFHEEPDTPSPKLVSSQSASSGGVAGRSAPGQPVEQGGSAQHRTDWTSAYSTSFRDGQGRLSEDISGLVRRQESSTPATIQRSPDSTSTVFAPEDAGLRTWAAAGPDEFGRNLSPPASPNSTDETVTPQGYTGAFDQTGSCTTFGVSTRRTPKPLPALPEDVDHE